MKTQYIKELGDRFFLRCHMSLILTAVLLSGFWSSKLLYYLGIHDLTIRYTTSFLISYATFFLCIRLWLWYVVESRKDKTDSHWDFWDFDLWFKGKSSSSPSWSGKGGEFSGGGASGSFADGKVNAVIPAVVPPSSSSSSSSSLFKDFDLDIGEGAPLVVVLLVLTLLLSALIATAYFVFNAPAILGEIAFQLALSLGVLKSADRKVHPFEWMTMAFKKTWMMAVVILVLICCTTLTIKHYRPDITKSSEIKEWILTGKQNL